MEKNSILFVGDHAQKYFGPSLAADVSRYDFNLFTYKREDILTGASAFANFNEVSFPFHGAYDLDGLQSDMMLNKQLISYDSKVLIGDPTELLFQAFIAELLESDTYSMLPIVLFLYPVGMISLDTRKEISALIHKMKLNHVLTYVIRYPQETVDKVMNALNELEAVSDFVLVENKINNLDYLFGHEAEILFNA